MQRMIDVVINNYVARHFFQRDSIDLFDFVDFQNVDDDEIVNVWRINELKLFNFKLSTSYDSNFMIKNEKDIIYRNVNFFIKKILNLTVIKKQKLIKINFNVCLQNEALMWYIDEFTSLKRVNFRQFDLAEK